MTSPRGSEEAGEEVWEVFAQEVRDLQVAPPADGPPSSAYVTWVFEILACAVADEREAQDEPGQAQSGAYSSTCDGSNLTENSPQP